jgi:hypothetical protein
MMLWLLLGNKRFKAWRSSVLEPYWEMLGSLFERQEDICEILNKPSMNKEVYDYAVDHRDTKRTFIKRSAVQPSRQDKKCDMRLFETDFLVKEGLEKKYSSLSLLRPWLSLPVIATLAVAKFRCIVAQLRPGVPAHASEGRRRELGHQGPL